MVTEKTIYIASDGMRFDVKEHADNYDFDYVCLETIINGDFGKDFTYVYCEENIETKHHTKQNLTIALGLVNSIIAGHDEKYHALNDSRLSVAIDTEKIKEYISTISHDFDSDQSAMLYRKAVERLKNQFVKYSYSFPDEKYFSNHMDNCLLFNIIKRLDNTSYKTGIEYPAYPYKNWALNENEWEEHVKYITDYKNAGGKWR